MFATFVIWSISLESILSDELLSQARASLDSLYQCLRDNPGDTPLPVRLRQWRCCRRSQNVVEALADDLNTPQALAALHELANRLRKATDAQAIASARAQLLTGAGFRITARGPRTLFYR